MGFPSGGGGSGPPPATTVTGPDTFGQAAVVGTGTNYARNDHGHGLPAAPAGTGRTALYVAASNSPSAMSIGCDYICTGTDDDATINSALAALTNGGKVILLNGDFYSSATGGVVVGGDGVTLEGSGRRGDTRIHIPASFTGTAGVALTATQYCTLRDLEVYFDAPAGITAPGVHTLCTEPVVDGVTVHYPGGSGVVVDGTGDNAWILDCEVLFAGAGGGTTSDAYVVTSGFTNAIFLNCYVQGGSPISCGILTSSLASGTAYTSLSVRALVNPVAAGDQIVIDAPARFGGASTTQVVTASAAAAVGATTIDVDSFTASAAFTAYQAVVVDLTRSPTRYGFNVGSGSNQLINCHPYFCYEAGVYCDSGTSMTIIGGQYENCGWTNMSLQAIWSGEVIGATVYGNAQYASVFCYNWKYSTLTGCTINGDNAVWGLYCYDLNYCSVTGNSVIGAAGSGSGGATFYCNGGSYASYVGNSIDGSANIALSSFGAHVVFANNPGINPFGPQAAPAVPASGTALTNPFPFDTAVYVSGGTVTAVDLGGTATGLTSGQFSVPAGETITLTYSAAPTWVWVGS